MPPAAAVAAVPDTATLQEVVHCMNSVITALQDAGLMES